MNKLIKQLQHKVISLQAKLEMYLTIKKVTDLHSKRKEDRYNERENRLFIALLELPYLTKKGKLKYKNSLKWVDRKNFRKLKSQRWIAQDVSFPDLRKKAFYTSNPERSYTEEYAERERAYQKYILYKTTTIV